MIENPGLSYGLFHASVSPVYSWGLARKVEFPGVNMDIGHVRNLTWTKDSDKSKWVNYNRMRGQYISGLEASMPERFFNNPVQCNLVGSGNPVAGLPDCPQGISAVKAIALAAAQGQKIYTITQSVYQANPNIVSSNLAAHSQSTQDKVQQALDAGYEVTIHETPIVQDGWIGAGYSMIDPNTGAGGYLIDGGVMGRDISGGGGNGSIILFQVVAIAMAVTPIVTILAGWLGRPCRTYFIDLYWRARRFISCFAAGLGCDNGFCSGGWCSSYRWIVGIVCAVRYWCFDLDVEYRTIRMTDFLKIKNKSIHWLHKYEGFLLVLVEIVGAVVLCIFVKS